MSGREASGEPAARSARRRAISVFHPAALLALRILLAAVFIYAGAQKIGKPLLFADEIHAYGVIGYGPPIYVAAIVLPWLEILCGVSLVTGIMLRGSALLLLVLNAVFIAVIAVRSASIVRCDSACFRCVSVSSNDCCSVRCSSTDFSSLITFSFNAAPT